MRFFILTILFFFSANSFAENISFVSDDGVIRITEFQTFNGKIDYENFSKLREQIGYSFLPFTSVKHQKFLNKKLAYDVTYNIGAFGLRQINQQLMNASAPKHFIIAGDSTIFNEGCNDEDTMIAQLARYEKNGHFYNFGMRGGSIHNTVALMDAYPWQSLIKEKEGVFLYVFESEYMLQRVIGSMKYLSWDGGQSPYFKIENGKLLRQGNFNNRFFITWFYKQIHSIVWLRKYVKDLPQLNEGHVDLAVELFKRAKFNYLKQFPKGQFIVSMRNSEVPVKPLLFAKFKEKLEAAGITVISLPDEVDDDARVLIPRYDGHPNKAGNLFKAQLFRDALQKINVFPL